VFKQFIKDSVIYTIGNILVRGVSYFLLPFYTRALSPSDFGLADILLVFTSFASITIALEIVQGVAVYFTENEDQKERIAYASTALWFAMIAYTIFGVFSLLFANPLSQWILGQPGKALIFSLSIFSTWGYGVSYLTVNQLRFDRKPQKYALTGLISSIVTIILTIVFVLFLKLGATGVVAGQMAGNLVNCFLAIYFGKTSYIFIFDLQKLKQMLSFSIPLVPSSVGSLIMIYVNRVAINNLLSLADVGIYGVAYRISSLIEFIMMGFRTALTPLIYENYQKPETPGEIARIFQYFVAFALLIVMFLGLFSKELVILLAQPSYYEAATIITILAPAYVLGQMNIFAPGWAITKKTMGFALINILGAILSIILNYSFIPIIGLSGAAWAILITNGLTFTAFMKLSQKYYYVPHKWKNLGIAAFFSLLVLFLNSYFNTINNKIMLIPVLAKLLALLFLCLIFIILGLIEYKVIKDGFNRLRMFFAR
jgi:O-antigen/teichoic acid export membrane protein